jgi:hypothetical protein
MPAARARRPRSVRAPRARSKRTSRSSTPTKATADTGGGDPPAVDPPSSVVITRRPVPDPEALVEALARLAAEIARGMLS